MMTLSDLRHQIDVTDDALWGLISHRLDIARQIGAYKRAEGLPVRQPERYAQLLQDRLRWAEQHGIRPETVRQIMDAIHEESVRVQNEK